jgi:hypothetical protein
LYLWILIFIVIYAYFCLLFLLFIWIYPDRLKNYLFPLVEQQQPDRTTEMSVAGPLVPRPAWPLTTAVAGDDGDDPIRRLLVSTHEADVEPINRQVLEFVCKQCLLAFVSIDSVKAHLQVTTNSGKYMLLMYDQDRRRVLVDTITRAQVEAYGLRQIGPS